MIHQSELACKLLDGALPPLAPSAHATAAYPVLSFLCTTNMKRRRNTSFDLVVSPNAPHLGISSVASIGQPFIDSVITPLITCKICAGAFSHLKNARVLHCGHSVCHDCISNMSRSDAQIQNNFSVSCPYCRSTCTFKKLEDFPKNFAVLDTIELVNSFTVSISCKKSDDHSILDLPSSQVGSTPLQCKRSTSTTAVTKTSNYIGSVDSGGKAHGNGSCIWPDGCWGLGQWKHGELFGFGGLFFPDGSVHIGEWVNGICHGFGLFMTPDGVVQSGVWRQGQCVIYDT